MRTSTKLCIILPPTLVSMMHLLACKDACVPIMVLLTLPVLDLIRYSDSIYSQCFVVITCPAHPEFQNGREFSTLPLCHGQQHLSLSLSPPEACKQD